MPLIHELTWILLIAHVIVEFYSRRHAAWLAGLLAGLSLVLMAVRGYRGTTLVLPLLGLISALFWILLRRHLEAKSPSLKHALIQVVTQGLQAAWLIFLSQRFFQGRSMPSWLVMVYAWTLLILLVLKPANTIFKTFFTRYQVEDLPAQETQSLPVTGAGAIIGNLERTLTAILLTLGQFATIAIIYTAKSIARYDRISKDQAFAEYYLIGTLYSALYVVVAWAVVMQILL